MMPTPPAAGQHMLRQPGQALHDPLVELIVTDEAVPVLVGGGEARVIGSGLDLQRSRQQPSQLNVSSRLWGMRQEGDAGTCAFGTTRTQRLSSDPTTVMKQLSSEGDISPQLVIASLLNMRG
jgi:hypothetical protein